MNSLLKNGSGYWDGVAYEAMKSLEKKKEVKVMLDIRRGDVVEYDNQRNNTHIIAIVISSDKNNQDDNQKKVVTCTLADTKLSEYCVPFKFRDKSYINCNCITSIYKSNCYSVVKTLSEDEMKAVDEMLRKALHLETEPATKTSDTEKAHVLKEKELEKAVRELKARNDEMFEDNVKYEKMLAELKQELAEKNETSTIRAEVERDVYKELYLKAMELR